MTSLPSCSEACPQARRGIHPGSRVSSSLSLSEERAVPESFSLGALPPPTQILPQALFESHLRNGCQSLLTLSLSAPGL